MSNIKQLFVESLLEEMSEDLKTAVLEAKIGEVGEISMPTDVDSAIIATGIANVNFNNAVLVPLANTPIVEAMMRIGQFNAVHIALLLASLQFNAPAYTDPTLNPLYPRWDMVYAPDSWDMIGVKVEGVDSADDIESVTAIIVTNNNEELSLSSDGNSDPCIFSDFYTFDLGSHTVKFSAVVGGETIETTEIHFSIEEGGSSGGGGASGEW